MAGRRSTLTTASGHCLPGIYPAMGGSDGKPLVVETSELVKVKQAYPGMYEVPFLVNVFRPFELAESAESAAVVRISAEDVVTIARTWQQMDEQAAHIDAGRIVGHIDDLGNYQPTH